MRNTLYNTRRKIRKEHKIRLQDCSRFGNNILKRIINKAYSRLSKLNDKLSQLPTYFGVTCQLLWCSSRQEILHLYGTQSPIAVFRPISWGQQTESHTLPSHFNIIHHPCGLSSSGPPRSYVFSLSAMRATCPTYLTLLKLIIPIIFGKGWTSYSHSICHFFQPPVTFPLLGHNIFHSMLFSKSLSLYSSPIVSSSFTPHLTAGKITVSNSSVFTFFVARIPRTQDTLHPS